MCTCLILDSLPSCFIRWQKCTIGLRRTYLICYHAPRLMVDEYGFDVELIVQTNTSMHGSTENHMGYIYKRVASKEEEG